MNPERRPPADGSNKAVSSAVQGAATAGTAPPFASGGGTSVATAAPFPPPGVIAPKGSPAAATPVRPGTLPPFNTPTQVDADLICGPGLGSSSFSRPGFVRMAKFLIAVIVVLATAGVFMKQALPVLMELSKPGSQPLKKEEAPTGVQVIRQTRAVVEKSNNNAAYLSAIIDNKEPPPDVKPPAPMEIPEPQQRPRAAETKVNLKAANRFIEELPINGVTGGETPRIIVGGLLVNVDDVVDWRLGLVFAGLDENARMILFRHKDGSLLQRKY